MPRKPPDRRQRPHTKDVGELVELPGGGRAPAPPKGLSPQRRTEWRDFWSSPLAQAVDVRTDLPALRRLFELRDRKARYLEAAEGNELVAGSTGQPSINPLVKQADVLEQQIVALEDRFAGSLKARLAVGITYGEAARSLDELNRRLLDRDDSDDEGEDPRLRAIDVVS